MLVLLDLLRVHVLTTYVLQVDVATVVAVAVVVLVLQV